MEGGGYACELPSTAASWHTVVLKGGNDTASTVKAAAVIYHSTGPLLGISGGYL